MKYTCRYISAEFPAAIRENVPDFNGLLVYCLIFCKKKFVPQTTEQKSDIVLRMHVGRTPIPVLCIEACYLMEKAR